MKQVTMLPEDFNSLTDIKVLNSQFTDSEDCPMTRALRRATGIKEIENCLSWVYTSNSRQIEINYVGWLDIKHAAEMVEKNGKFNFRFGVDISRILKE